MDSCEEVSSESTTPKEIYNGVASAAQNVLPKTKERYDRRYQMFKEWQASRNYTVITQPVLMAYFSELAQTRKPTSLWASFSMLKSRIRLHDNIDIGSYSELLSFIRSKSEGYSPVKASVFSSEDIQKFIDTAPDEYWLDVKVVCIFGVTGACNTNELPRLRPKDVESHGDVILVRVMTPQTTTNTERSFPITGKFCRIVQKYMALRVPHISQERFFINYQRGKCTNQAIGKNKFYQMPRRIAKFLKLPHPESYTGNSFRRTSRLFNGNSTSTIFINGIDNGPTAAISTAVSQTYSTSNSFNGTLKLAHGPNETLHPLTNYANEPNKKFGEIYCSPMGVLSYHCVLCPAQMEHSDEFSLHYMSHFRDVFQNKRESDVCATLIGRHYTIAEPMEPTSTIKLEDTQIIKSEPIYSDDVNTNETFILS